MPQSILITGVTFLLCGGIASPLPAFLSTAPGLLPSAGRLPAGPRDGLDRKVSDWKAAAAEKSDVSP